MSNRWTIYDPEKAESFSFQGWSPALDAKIGACLSTWRGTPYVEGAATRGAGADCVRALAGVIADVAGYIPVPINRLPADAALSDPKRAWAAMRALLTEFKADRIEDGTLRPLDILVTRPPGIDTGPGHGLLVGPHKSLWHMDRLNGFCKIGNSLGASVLVGTFRVPFDLWAV